MTQDKQMNILVAICTANRSHYLTLLLGRLTEINFGAIPCTGVSILIVDNAPSGEVATLCNKISQTSKVRLDVVEERAPGISEARNRAAREAIDRKFDFVAFLDDDDLPDHDWLYHLSQKQVETDADIVMGNRRTPSGCVIDPEASDNEIRLWKRNGLPNLLSTCNVLIRTRIFEDVSQAGYIFNPFFSPMGGEDADFFIRSKRAGARFTSSPLSCIQFRTEGARSTTYGRIMRKLKAGCSQGHLARKYIDGAYLALWLGESMWRLFRDSLLLAPDFIIRGRSARSIPKLAWTIGSIWGFLGGRVDYYTNPNLTR